VPIVGDFIYTLILICGYADENQFESWGMNAVFKQRLIYCENIISNKLLIAVIIFI
jgi:hypothetical protein